MFKLTNVINKSSMKRFFNAYKFSNHDDIKFILLLQWGVYLYEFMNDWEKFKETSKKTFIVT